MGAKAIGPQNLNSWTTDNVTSMARMFEGSNFNGNISNWNVNKVDQFQGMFSRTPFNGDLSGWNTSSAVNLGHMVGHPSLFLPSKFAISHASCLIILQSLLKQPCLKAKVFQNGKLNQ